MNLQGMDLRGKTVFGFVLGLVILAAGMADTRAFSLMGPYESWMTQANGFDQLGDIGGPMEFGSEYRWNVPVVTYAFDASFINYFGTNGVAAVESAIQTLNNLPPASQIDPTTFPLNTTVTNSKAQANGLIDLKSEALSVLLNQMGLAQPQRFMFCVYASEVVGPVPTRVSLVVLRNYDPLTFAATNVLNGTLYYSNVTFNVSSSVITATACPTDTNAPTETAVADGGVGFRPGLLYTGLTADDVGGLRYLLTTNNINLESLLSDVTGTGTNAGNYLNVALRGGVDKITFVEPPLDSLLNESFFQPYTNQYTDTYITNGVLMQQQLARVTTRPDIVFSAYDSPTAVAPAVQCTSTANWLNTGGAPGIGGPGIIQPQVTIAFRKFGSSAVAVTGDSGSPAYVSNERWASYDASTNAPVIYPTVTGAIPGYPWTFQFSLVNESNQPLTGGQFTWELPVSKGGAAVLETSTNLTDWTPLTTVTNYGTPFTWQHVYSRPTGYFQVVPQ